MSKCVFVVLSNTMDSLDHHDVMIAQETSALMVASYSIVNY